MQVVWVSEREHGGRAPPPPDDACTHLDPERDHLERSAEDAGKKIRVGQSAAGRTGRTVQRGRPSGSLRGSHTALAGPRISSGRGHCGGGAEAKVCRHGWPQPARCPP